MCRYHAFEVVFLLLELLSHLPMMMYFFCGGRVGRTKKDEAQQTGVVTPQNSMDTESPATC